MQKKRNILLLALMSSSILLLLILQFFWIRSEYKNAEDSFKREANLVFKSTVSELLDSLYMARIDLLHEDSTIQFKRRKIQKPNSEDNIILSAFGKALRLDLSKSTLILTKDTTDNVAGVMKERTKAGKSFMIRMNPDSLDITSIKTNYVQNLNELDRKLKIKVVEKACDTVSYTTTSYMTDFIRIGPPTARQYAASFEGVPLLLFKQIYPQILFSFILTLLIIGAFVMMYRNLLMQQKLSIQKDDFINNVSHELKTPIATVNVALEAFKSFKVLDNPKMTQEYLHIMESELERLSMMTEKILNASVYENKGIQMDKEEVDLKSIVDSVAKTTNVVWDKAALSVETAFCGTDFTLKGSKIHLTNVLHNLLDNAAKYSGSPAHISVKLIEERENIILEVKDEGAGIPEEYRNKIFEKFFRVPHGDVHNVKGYGLGLSYVAQVVKAHKGTITVASEIEKGSTFSIQLPKNV